MTYDIKDIIYILEYYKSLGIESLPIADIPNDSKTKDNKVDDISKSFNNLEIKEDEKLLNYYLTYNEKIKALNLLREEIGDCKRCKLSKGRTNIVFGEGNADTSIMFIGEAPGREEDIQGRPFVGQAGQILTSLIYKMGKETGFTRKDVYIANIVKCRPPQNRDPEPDEIASCITFLNKQIKIIRPLVIMALGRISTHTLMGLKTPLNKFSISEVRGNFFDYKIDDLTIPVMPTFHPAYFLRNRKDKHLTWSDALTVLDILKRRMAK